MSVDAKARLKSGHVYRGAFQFRPRRRSQQQERLFAPVEFIALVGRAADEAAIRRWFDDRKSGSLKGGISILCDTVYR